MKICVVVLLILTAGCCGSRQGEPPSMREQLDYLDRESILHFQGDYASRRFFAMALLRLPPEDRGRFQMSAVDLRKPTSTGCGVARAAEADVAAGHFNILMAGDTFIPWETEERMRAHISTQYGVRHFTFSFGGTEPAQFVSLIETYNRVVEDRIQEAFGKSHYDMWLEAKEAVEQNQRMQRTDSR